MRTQRRKNSDCEHIKGVIIDAHLITPNKNNHFIVLCLQFIAWSRLPRSSSVDGDLGLLGSCQCPPPHPKYYLLCYLVHSKWSFSWIMNNYVTWGAVPVSVSACTYNRLHCGCKLRHKCWVRKQWYLLPWPPENDPDSKPVGIFRQSGKKFWFAFE